MKNTGDQEAPYAFSTQTSMLLFNALTKGRSFALLAMSYHKINEHRKAKRTDGNGVITVNKTDINNDTSPFYSLQQVYSQYGGRVGFDIMYDNNDTDKLKLPDTLLLTFDEQQVVALKQTLQSILKALFNLESGSDVVDFKARLDANIQSKETSVDDIIINLPVVKFDLANKVAEATRIDVLGYKATPQISLIINRPNLADAPDGQLEAVLLFAIKSRRSNYKCFVDIGMTLTELVTAVNS